MTFDNFIEASDRIERVADSCPECGEPVVHEQGCVRCRACGESACG